MKALIFDLDGTLIDSVFPHALSWQQALIENGMTVAAWEIQRHIGISGKLLVKMLARERGRALDLATVERLECRHDELYRTYAALQLPLPGAIEILQFLRDHSIAHGLATTGKRSGIEPALKSLSIPNDTIIVDSSVAANAKPEPDLFVRCAELLGVDKSHCLIVGDSVWDVHAARRAGIVAIGVLTGGFGEQELYNAGAMRVYRDTRAILSCVEELGLELS